MSVKLLSGMTNVLRFPVERCARPTLELLRGMAPDLREVMNMAEAFGMERPPPDLRERADIAKAEHIANQMPAGGAKREALLGQMSEPIIARAIASCSEAHDAWLEAAAAEEASLRARQAGNFASEPLEERAAVLARRAAEHSLIAHMRSEEAEGVARAVRFARDGEAWRPRDVCQEAEEVFGFAAREA